MVMSVSVYFYTEFWQQDFERSLDKLSKYCIFEKKIPISKSNLNNFETLKDFNFNLKTH